MYYIGDIMRKSVKADYLKCLRCGHVWKPKKTDVRTCPGCRSPYWDRPRLKRKKKDG